MTKATAAGGTVYSWVDMGPWPYVLIMVGVKYPKPVGVLGLVKIFEIDA